jgi:predicted dehydrogenase
LQNLADRASIIGTADVDMAKAREAADEVGAELAVTDFHELLDKVDAVTVATPHDQHFAIGLAAARAGKHVFMEKPLVMTEAQGRDLIEAADAAGVVLMTGYPLRFHPLVVRIKDAIDAGTYGRPIHASLNTDQYLRAPAGHWRNSPESRGGGGLFSHGCHYIDLLLWFLGNPARGTHIGTSYGTPWPSAGETTSHALIEFDSGAVGHHFGTEVAKRAAGVTRFVVHCEGGTLEASLSDGRLVVDTGTGEQELATAPGRTKFTQQELAHFIDSVENGTRPLTDGRRSLQSLRVIWRLYEAERAGTVADLTGLGLDAT